MVFLVNGRGLGTVVVPSLCKHYVQRLVSKWGLSQRKLKKLSTGSLESHWHWLKDAFSVCDFFVSVSFCGLFFGGS